MDNKEVFISYSSKDKKTALKLLEVLEAKGLSCWIAERDIAQGTNWAEEIDKAIQGAKAFVVIISKNSIGSSQVPKEIGLAISSCQCIIPFKIQEVELEGAFRYYLSDCQWVNATDNLIERMDDVGDSLCRILNKSQVKLEKEIEPKPSPFKYRWALMGVGCILVVLFVLVFANSNLDGLNQEVENSERNIETTVDTEIVEKEIIYETILLRPNDNISTRDYYKACEILEERMKFFWGEENYSIEKNIDYLKIDVPLSCFGEFNPEYIFKAYLARPCELYLAVENDYDKTLHIEREHIESVEIVSNIDSGLEDIRLTFSDEKATEVLEFCKLYSAAEDLSATDNLVLAQDVNMAPSKIYYYSEIRVEDNGKVIIVHNSDEDNKLNEYVVYNYTSETFLSAFEMRFSVPAVWLEDKNDGTWGNFQLSFNEFDSEAVDVVLVNNYDATYGEWYDAVQEIKSIFDTVKIPYAIGYLNYDSNAIVLRTESKKLNEEFFDLLCEAVNINLVVGDYRLSAGLYIKSYEVVKDEAGNDVVACECDFSSIKNNEKNELYQKIIAGESVALYLNNLPILFGMYDGTRMVFDESAYDSSGKISDNILPHIFILNENVQTDLTARHNYSLEYVWSNYYEIDVWDHTFYWGVENKYLDKLKEAFLLQYEDTTIRNAQIEIYDYGWQLKMPIDSIYGNQEIVVSNVCDVIKNNIMNSTDYLIDQIFWDYVDDENNTKIRIVVSDIFGGPLSIRIIAWDKSMDLQVEQIYKSFMEHEVISECDIIVKKQY